MLAETGATANERGRVMLLGCIADDLTGATDLSLMLTKEGLRTVQSTGVPGRDLDLADVDALVIALNHARSRPPKRSRCRLRPRGRCSGSGRSGSCSNIARPSTRPTTATSAP